MKSGTSEASDFVLGLDLDRINAPHAELTCERFQRMAQLVYAGLPALGLDQQAKPRAGLRARRRAGDHDASRDCCHARLFRTVMPMRRDDNRITIGPPGNFKIRRPVRGLKLFTPHHWKKVRT
jgi:hypothetical protein